MIIVLSFFMRVMLKSANQLYQSGNIVDLRRLVSAFGYSIQGLQTAWKTEVAFRQEVVVFVAAVVVVFGIDFSLFERFFSFRFADISDSCRIVK